MNDSTRIHAMVEVLEICLRPDSGPDCEVSLLDELEGKTLGMASLLAELAQGVATFATRLNEVLPVPPGETSPRPVSIGDVLASMMAHFSITLFEAEMTGEW